MADQEDLFTAAERRRPKQPKTIWLNADAIEKLEIVLAIAPDKEKILDKIRAAVEPEIERIHRQFTAICKNR